MSSGGWLSSTSGELTTGTWTGYIFCLMVPGINSVGNVKGRNQTLDAVIHNSLAAELCPVLMAPSGGSFHMTEATERSLGSVALFSCFEGFKLLGHYKLRCEKKGNGLQWSHREPQCQATTLMPHKGFRLAVIIALVSSFLIFTVFVAFTICCMQERQLSLQRRAACARSDPRPGFSMEIEEQFSRSSFHPNSLRKSNFYESVYFKGPKGFENCGFQT